MRYQPFDWYETPRYYDLIFDEGTPVEADFLAAVHERYCTSGGRRMLEPACGSGRLLAAMARRGFHVTGFDASDGMLAFARRRIRRQRLRAGIVKASMESFRLRGPFDCAHCLVSTFKYLLDERSAQSHLRRLAEHLRPGGIYVLGMHLTQYEDRSRNRERWVVRRDGLEVVCNIQGWPADQRSRTERVRSRLIVRSSGRAERRYETNWIFRTYSLRQLRALLRAVPAFDHVATFDFRYDISQPIRLDSRQLDVVLVLRRKGPARRGR